MASRPRYKWSPLKIGVTFENIIHAESFDRKKVLALYYRRRLRAIRADGLSPTAARPIARDFAERDAQRAEEHYFAIQEKRERDLAGEPRTSERRLIDREGNEQAYRDRRHTGRYRIGKIDTTG